MFGILGAALAIWCVLDSPSFQSCINEAQYSAPENQFPKIASDFLRSPGCVGEFLKTNETVFAAYSTVIIAIFTTILGIFTISLARSSRISADAAKTAAQAADLSARAAIALQLPIIRVQPDSLSREEFPQSENCYVNSVTVSNMGARKAFPKEIIYGWTVGEVLPDKPKYTSADKFPLNSILEPDIQKSVMQSLTGVQLLKKGEWSKICRGNYLWFYCTIFYDDFMEETRSHGFCWRWSDIGMGMGWRADTKTAYNQKT